MSSSSRDSGKLGGLVWILFGGVFLAGAIPISRPQTVTDTDPGPRALPLVLSVTLLLGGGLQIALSCRRGREVGNPSSDDFADRGIPIQPRHTSRAILFFIGLWIYVPGISLIGFIPTTLLMAPLAMCGLGSRLRVAIPISALLVLSIHVLFARIFHVLLPTGYLWG